MVIFIRCSIAIQRRTCNVFAITIYIIIVRAVCLSTIIITIGIVRCTIDILIAYISTVNVFKALYFCKV
ncbi:MAG: hypothetical protein IPP49_12030 [Saprospiraceae bacterium]|nr:hypothetical protein [Saprospiraceae bacterium]